MTAEALWNEFCDKYHVERDEKHQAWAFGGGPEVADGLLALVLAGKKFGTASLYEAYVSEHAPIPGDREYSVILNTAGEAVCVIRNYEVRVEPFERVSEYHGFSEGEEERNLWAWRRIHTDFWQEDLKQLGIASVKDAHAVLEKFTLEYVPDSCDLPHVEPDEYFLIEPNIRYAEQILEYREAMLAAASSMDGCLSMKRMQDPVEWVEHSYEWGNPMRDLGENGVRGTLLMYIRKRDDRLLGMIQIRKIPPTHEKAYVGHIGYSVHPAERRKGYAGQMLARSLVYLKYGLSVDRAEISALPENEASKRTILANGGIYRDTIRVESEGVSLDRFFIDLTDL